MSKLPQLVIEPFLLEPLLKWKFIKSMTNKAYKKNIPKFEKLLLREQRKSISAYKEIADIIINW